MAAMGWLGCFGLCGCMHAAPESHLLPSRTRALVVVSAGDTTTLQLTTRPGCVYTILYTDDPPTLGTSRWFPLPGYEKMAGDGTTLTLRQPYSPAQPRRYTVRVRDDSGKPVRND